MNIVRGKIAIRKGKFWVVVNGLQKESIAIVPLAFELVFFPFEIILQRF